MLLDELVVRLGIEGDMKPLNYVLQLTKQLQSEYLKLQKNDVTVDCTQALDKIQGLQDRLNKLDAGLDKRREILINTDEAARNTKDLADKIKELEAVKKKQDMLNKYGVLQADGTKRRINLGEILRRKTEGATNAFAALKQQMMALQYGNPILAKLINSIQMFGAMAGIGFSVQKYIQISDQWKTIEGQIKNVSKDSNELESTQKELYNIASRTRQNYSETAGLFTSVSRNASELGKNTGDILKFTEDVSNAMLLGGGSAASQQAALVQLGQALGSGVLRGDELNSIMEQAPRLAKVIAEGMGTSIGNLRKLGSEGKITAVAVFDAVRKESEKLKKELGNTPWTVQQATIKAQNAMGMLFYTLEKKSSIGTTIAEAIAKVSTILERINAILVDIPAERLQNMMKTLVIYAGVFYMLTKRAAIAQGISTAVTFVRQLAIAFRTATTIAAGLEAMVASIGATSAVSMIVATGGLILVAALIVALILLIQDFYVWVNGGKSVLGENFGSWNDFIAELSRRWEQWKTEFGKSMDWIGERMGKFGNWILDAIKNSETLQAVWNSIKSVFEACWDVLNKIAKILTGEDLNTKIDKLVTGTGKLDAAKVMTDANAISNKTQNNNQVYNLTVNAKDAKEAPTIFDNWIGNRAQQDISGDILESEAS